MHVPHMHEICCAIIFSILNVSIEADISSCFSWGNQMVFRGMSGYCRRYGLLFCLRFPALADHFFCRLQESKEHKVFFKIPEVR